MTILTPWYSIIEAEEIGYNQEWMIFYRTASGKMAMLIRATSEGEAESVVYEIYEKRNKGENIININELKKEWKL